MNDTTRREFLGWLARSGVGLAAAGVTLAAQPATADPFRITLLRRVTVIDGTGARPKRDASVLIAGERIVAVGGPDLPVPPHARVVDLPGRYVIPGLWDMHVHGAALETIVPPLCLVNGVTGIREMWGFAPSSYELRDRVARGELLGPRMVVASPIIDGPDSVLVGSLQVRTEAEARAAVRDAATAGADFIKVYPYLDRTLLTAIADESRAVGLPFAGHASDRLSVAEASDLGQRTFEHLYGMTLAVSAREHQFRRRIDSLPLDPADPFAWFAAVRELERQAASSQRPGKVAALAKRLRHNGSWQSPTLVTMRVFSSPADTYTGDERMKYLPPSYERFWAQTITKFAPVTPEQIVQQREYFAARLRLVGELHRHGVGFLLGTDAGNPYTFPGFSLHEELALLVEAGLSPLAAIQAGSRDAARFLGIADGGTVQSGRTADLVVLDADPLRDIRNTTRIDTVLTCGRVLTKPDRERMLSEVERAAAEFPPPPQQTCC